MGPLPLRIGRDAASNEDGLPPRHEAEEGKMTGRTANPAKTDRADSEVSRPQLLARKIAVRLNEGDLAGLKRLAGNFPPSTFVRDLIRRELRGAAR